MKKYLKYALALFTIIIIYLIGNWFPIDLFRPDFVDQTSTITNEEWYKLIISIFATSITVCAVIVALFKDDIREWWKYARVKFTVPVKQIIEITSGGEGSSSDGVIVANRYISRIEIQNCGNLPLINAEVYLDKLQYFQIGSDTAHDIEISGTPIKWNGSGATSISIPPGGKKLINVAEVIGPEKISTPDAQTEKKLPTFIIGDFLSDRNKGKWLATFTLYAQNHKAESFVIKIEWDGLWKQRLTEMDTVFKITKTA